MIIYHGRTMARMLGNAISVDVRAGWRCSQKPNRAISCPGVFKLLFMECRSHKYSFRTLTKRFAGPSFSGAQVSPDRGAPGESGGRDSAALEHQRIREIGHKGHRRYLRAHLERIRPKPKKKSCGFRGCCLTSVPDRGRRIFG